MSARGEPASSPFPPTTYDATAYRRLSDLTSVPSIGSAWAAPLETGRETVSRLLVTLSHTDAVRDEKAASTQSVVVHHGSAEGDLAMAAVSTTPATMAAPAMATSLSPSGRRRLVFTKEGKDKALTVAVWRGSCKVADVVVAEAMHGDLILDNFFATKLAWSIDERHVVYVAERGLPPPPAESKGRDDAAAASAGDSAEIKKATVTKLQQDTVLRDDWGERNTKRRAPACFVLDVEALSIAPVPGQADDVSYGQPCWAPDGQLIMVAWPHGSAEVFPGLQNKRLGLVYCFNRATQLVLQPAPTWAASNAVDGARLLQLRPTPPLQSVMEPRVSPDGATLVFVSHEEACTTGVHNASVSLHTARLKGITAAAGTQDEAQAPSDTGDPVLDLPHTCIVGSVRLPADVSSFPGLFSATLSATLLPALPFLDEATVVVNTLWRSAAAIVAVDLESGRVSRLTPDDASHTMLATDGALLFASRSSMRALPQLAMLRVPEALGIARAASGAAAPGWAAIGAVLPLEDVPESVSTLLQDVELERLHSPAGRCAGGSESLRDHHAARSPAAGAAGDAEEASGPSHVESLLYRRASRPCGSVPGVVFLHGGPHAAVMDAFNAPLLFLLAQGFDILLPNYRGSTGYGSGSLLELPGNIGEMDVTDCRAAVQHAVDHGRLDESNLVVTGGSHGGWLVGHLIGQHPGLFRAAAARNPVLSLPLMAGLTDIPDWVWIEGCGVDTRKQATLPLPTDVTARLHAMSPVAHLHDIVSPVMLFLGELDRRVPASQGLAFASSLRCLGKAAVEINSHDKDNHALDRSQTSFHCWMRIAAFFQLHTKAAA